MLEDRYLILRFNRGDRSALHRIYDKYKDDLVSLAAALLMDVSLAEDVVHHEQHRSTGQTVALEGRRRSR